MICQHSLMFGNITLISHMREEHCYMSLEWTDDDSSHRCTVVGNPGRGVLGFFWQILLRGYLGLWENQRGVGVFYCIFMWKFFKNLYKRYMRCPLPPPPCVHLWFKQNVLNYKNRKRECRAQKCFYELFVDWSSLWMDDRYDSNSTYVTSPLSYWMNHTGSIYFKRSQVVRE